MILEELQFQICWAGRWTHWGILSPPGEEGAWRDNMELQGAKGKLKLETPQQAISTSAPIMILPVQRKLANLADLPSALSLPCEEQYSKCTSLLPRLLVYVFWKYLTSCSHEERYQLLYCKQWKAAWVPENIVTLFLFSLVIPELWRCSGSFVFRFWHEKRHPERVYTYPWTPSSSSLTGITIRCISYLVFPW